MFGLPARAIHRHGGSRVRMAADLGQNGALTHRYTIIRSLGTGGQSQAIHVVMSQDTGRVFVAKRVSAFGRMRHHRATVEKNVLLHIPWEHQNLNFVRDYFWDSRATEFTFFLGYCDVGDLFVRATVQLCLRHEMQDMMLISGMCGSYTDLDIGSDQAAPRARSNDPRELYMACHAQRLKSFDVPAFRQEESARARLELGPDMSLGSSPEKYIPVERGPLERTSSSCRWRLWLFSLQV